MNRAASRILIIEDDRNIAALIDTYLKKAGFHPLVAEDGEQGLALAATEDPDLVILDLMLPRIDGWEVCRRLREGSDIPIIMLTARGEETDRILGFALQADDYVVKPFSPRELTERVKAVLRRSGAPRSAPAGVLVRGDLRLDPERREVTRNGCPINLTASEFSLLHLLMQHPGRVFDRQSLLDHLHPRGEVVVDRVIDVHIRNVRNKLNDDAARPDYLETVRGVGYRFRDSPGHSR